MNRKGTLDWIAEFLIKTVVAVLILLGILYMSGSLTSIFFSAGEKDFRAKRNLDLLLEQTDIARTEGQGSVLLQMPPERLLIGFDAGEKSIRHDNRGGLWRIIPSGEEICSADLQKPSGCPDDEACVCVIRFAYTLQGSGGLTCRNVTLQEIACESLEGIREVSGTTEDDFEINTGGIVDWNLHLRGDGEDDLFVLGPQHGPRNILIRVRDSSILFHPACYHDEKGDRCGKLA